jgi:type II secretory pathway pseudopilin PulG
MAVERELLKMRHKRRQCGWLMIEVLVTISILVLLAGALTGVMLSAGKGNRMLRSKQQALAAVAAQLDCLSHAGAPLPKEESERLWPNFSCTIIIVSGDGLTELLECGEGTVRAIKKTFVRPTLYPET